MPFLEINDFGSLHGDVAEVRAHAARLLTAAVAGSYSVQPSIITIYFSSFSDNAYAHAGAMPTSTADKRIFIKLHALHRDLGARRQVAAAITDATVTAYGIAPRSVAVYFLSRSLEEVAHAGEIKGDAVW